MRTTILALLALTCACGATNPSDVSDTVAASPRREALGLDKPALMDFAPRSAAFDSLETNGVQSVFLVLSDAKDACAQMQKKRNTAGSRRISVTLVHGAAREALTGHYPLAQPFAKPGLGQNMAHHAEMEIIDAQCSVSRPVIGSGEVHLTALTNDTASASIRLALSALGLESLGTFEQEVSLQHCPGMYHTDGLHRAQWACP